MATNTVFAGVGIDYCPVCERERPFHYDICTMPAGLTGCVPMPYGYRRWNGAIWPNCQVDAYNEEFERIIIRHRAGMDTTALVDGLYNLAFQFDKA